MDMSIAITTEVFCSECDGNVVLETWVIVDTAERPDLLQQIREGTLRNPVCQICGEARLYVDAPLLMYRSNRSPVLMFSPARRFTRKQNREEADQLVFRLRNTLDSAWKGEWLEQSQVVNLLELPAVLTTEEANGTSNDTTEAIRLLIAEAGVLGQQLRALGKAPGLDEAFQVVRDNPDLLTDESLSLLAQIVNIAQAECADFLVFLLADRLALLRQCRMLGIEEAFAQRGSAHDSIPTPREYAEQVSVANEGMYKYTLYADLEAV
jgi:hypothetical protein